MSKQTVPAIPAKTHSLLQPPYPEAHHYHNGTQWVVARGVYHIIDGKGAVLTTFRTTEDIPTHEFICLCCNDASRNHTPCAPSPTLWVRSAL